LKVDKSLNFYFKKVERSFNKVRSYSIKVKLNPTKDLSEFTKLDRDFIKVGSHFTKVNINLTKDTSEFIKDPLDLIKDPSEFTKVAHHFIKGELIPALFGFPNSFKN